MSLCDPSQGDFWNLNETWYTEHPRLSQCLRSTLLVWVPATLCNILSLLDVLVVTNTPRNTFVSSRKSISAIISLLLGTILSLCLLGESVVVWVWEVGAKDPWNVLISDLYLAISIGLLLSLSFLHQTRGYVSSGSKFFSLLVLSVWGGVELWAKIVDILSEVPNLNKGRFVLFCLLYACILLSFVLSFFALEIASLDGEHPKASPEPKSSFANKLMFSWFTPVTLSGWRKTLGQEDLWNVNMDQTSEATHSKLNKHIEKSFALVVRSKRFEVEEDVVVRSTVKEPSFTLILLKTYGWPYFLSGLFKLVSDLIIFVDPIIIKSLIDYASDESEPVWHGVVYIAAIFVALLTGTFATQLYYDTILKTGLKVKSALISVIYRKAMRMTTEARKEFTVGEIVNLMSVDATRMQDVADVIHWIWSAPLQIGLILYFLYNTLGYAMFVGLGVMVLMIPFNALGSHLFDKYQEKQMEHKDERIKFITEILNGIKLLKLYAWELPFQQKVQDIRKLEVGYLKKVAYVHGVLEFLWNCSLLMVCITTFGTYVLIHGELSPARAFVAFYLFQRLDFPIAILPMAVAYIAMFAVSIRRLRRFFSAQELSPHDIHRNTPSIVNPVEMRRASFSWESGAKGLRSPVLKDLSLKVSSGFLVAVVGKVGCGKSSLLSALCGELHKIKGYVALRGSLAYASQQAWIQNMTVRDNILFGKAYDESRYNRVVEACALKSDLDILAYGDQTEIGERGINLSGGQKQRVSLARSVYENADLYFLDDPLSAVDIHVGKHIFDKVVGPEGLLARKARILVSHNLTFLSKCDWIVFMKEGEIAEQGTYKDMLKRKQDFAELIAEFLHEVPDEELEEMDEEILRQLSSSPTTRSALERRISRKRLTTETDTEVGVGSAVLQRLVSAESSSSPQRDSSPRRIYIQSPFGTTPVLERLNCGEVPGLSGEESPLVVVSEKDEVKPEETNTAGNLVDEEEVHVGKIPWKVYYLYIKASGMAIFWYLVFVVLADGMYAAASVWLQIWSDSMNEVALNKTNSSISLELGIGIYAGFGALQAVLTGIMTVFFIAGQIKASQTIHDNLLNSILRAPMSFFDTTPTGRIVNRCGKDMEGVDNEVPMTILQVAYFVMWLVSALVLVLYALPTFILVAIPVGIVFFFVQRFYVATCRQLRRLESVSRSPIYSFFQESLQGVDTIRAYEQQNRFILHSEQKVDQNNKASYAVITCNRWLGIRLGLMANFLGCMAATLVIIQRSAGISAGLVGLAVSNGLNFMDLLSWGVRQLSRLETEIVAVERIREYTETPSEAPWTSPSPPPPSWPPSGAVTFSSYSTRYRPGLDLVLKGIDCKINPGEKIGIVGRTGAGKSSMTLALFRLVEGVEGEILIDGLPISRLGLHELRKHLAIIPQDPLLFSGSIRLNVDPFDTNPDDAVWNALEMSSLEEFVGSLDGGLSYVVSEGGSNLSVGQRQLLCLARALLRETRVLILDEATAAVDVKTDAIVQETIQREFKHCTVLTIAHRINTIMDSDRIMVLSYGKLVEFDTPGVLMKNETSEFRAMVSSAGLLPTS